MRITGVDTLILRRPDVTDAGDSSQDLLVVEVHTDEGITGVGEADTSPEVGAAVVHAPLSHDVCRGLALVVEGRDPFAYEAIWRDMYRASTFYGRGGAAAQAMAAIDLALWDIMGKAIDRPVWQLLGGPCAPGIRAYCSLLMPDDPGELADLVAAAKAESFTAAKFGWGGLGRSLAHDEALVSAARRAAGDEFDVMIDMGSPGWGRDFRTVEQFATMCARYGVFWLEEPFAPDDYGSYARLRVAGLRIAAGEEETTRFGFERLLGTGGVDVVQPDPARAGGLTECRRVAWRAADLGLALAPHAWSSPIVRAAALHLCLASPNALVLEYSRHPSPVGAAIRWEATMRDGLVLPPAAPGLGIELDRVEVERYRIA
jgi:L-rhamnonate dehydratase